MIIGFDYDGVIVDSLPRLTRLVAEAAESLKLGRLPTEDDFRVLENVTFPSMATHLGVPDGKIAEFSDKVLELQKLDETYPDMFPRIKDVILTLLTDNQLFIATASLEAELRKVFLLNGLGDKIDLIFDGADPRPKAEKIVDAFKRFNVRPEETYFVGDARSDIRNGKCAGVKTVAVTWGFHSRDALTQEQPDFIVDSPDELLKVLKAERAK